MNTIIIGDNSNRLLIIINCDIVDNSNCQLLLLLIYLSTINYIVWLLLSLLMIENHDKSYYLDLSV